MTKKIKIVTAFFDIGRSASEVLPRTNSEYMDYFSFWAGIQNEMVIYCQPQYCKQIMTIRKKYSLEDKTEVIPIEDIYAIDPITYSRMKIIQNDSSFCNFRYYNNALSNNASYDYIMMMKYWFMSDCAKRTDEDCFIAWNDFGYNHGGKYYLKQEDFSFLWEYDFPEKVNAFCLCNPDTQSLVDSLQFQRDCFIGSPIIMPKRLCQQMWNEIKDSMDSLLKIGCIDDDQFLQLMVYKQKPEIYSIIVCDWFEAFAICSDHSFTVANKNRTGENNISILRKANRKISRLLNQILTLSASRKSLNGFVNREKARWEKYRTP